MQHHEIRELLRQIRRSNNSFPLTHRQALKVQAEWLRLFGTGGCSYPYTSEWDMVKDLWEHYKI